MITKLKWHLLNKGKRQFVVAREANISETRMSRLVTGRATATVDERTRLGRVLGISPAELDDEIRDSA